MEEAAMTLVDASSWIEYLRGRASEPSHRVRRLLADDQAAWCDLTTVELWNGARGSAEKTALRGLEAELRLCPVDEQAWANARHLAQRCRDKGVTVNTSDIIVVACAVRHRLRLEHCDRHLDLVLGITGREEA